MTRKRYKKLMMSMGWSRNQVNDYKPFTMWPFYFMPSICSYNNAWQLDKPIFEFFKNIRDQINTGVSFEYNGYTTCVKYDKRDRIFYGKLEDINDLINFHTDNIMKIEEEFHNAVDDYLDFCARIGKEPEKPNV